ncbi:MAG: hypothetical protein P8016_08075, partial [Sedimentisphaerales bacterium]
SSYRAFCNTEGGWYEKSVVDSIPVNFNIFEYATYTREPNTVSSLSQASTEVRVTHMFMKTITNPVPGAFLPGFLGLATASVKLKDFV